MAGYYSVAAAGKRVSGQKKDLDLGIILARKNLAHRQMSALAESVRQYRLILCDTRTRMFQMLL
ncbi:MAG: hypothetical protein OEM25_08085 [Gammaproteobacteria bacterium]|nr:hypothetical protein [Gammaproteobacteria bacterium]